MSNIYKLKAPRCLHMCPSSMRVLKIISVLSIILFIVSFIIMVQWNKWQEIYLILSIGFNNLNMAHVDTLWNIYLKNHDCFDLCCIFHANPPWTALGLLPQVAGFFNLISMGDPLSITRSTPPSPQMSEFEVQRKRAKSVYTRARWECSEFPKTTRKHSRSVILRFNFKAGLPSSSFWFEHSLLHF